MFEVHDPRFDPEPQKLAPQDEAFEDPEARGGRGCLFWGCLITAIIFLVLLIGIPVGIYFGAKHLVNKFTTEEPAGIAVVELPEEQLVELATRFEAFGKALKSDEAPADFELTAEELNGLINENDDFRGRVFVRIKDGQIGGDVSIPMDKLPGGSGRFLNATVDFDVSMAEGQLVVVLNGATVNGTSIPKEVLDELANENLAQELVKDKEAAKVLAKFDSLEITGDRIALRAKRETPVATDEPVSPEIESFETVETP